MLKYVCGFFACLLAFDLQAQQWTAKNAFYLDLGDTYQVNYSFNYSRIIHHNKTFALSVGAGISVEPVEFSKFWQPLFPLETILVFGQKNHHWEGGFTLTPGVYYDQYTFIDYPNSNEPQKLISNKTFGSTVGLRIGYRYQKQSGGFFFRTGFTPTLFSSFTPFYLNYIDIGEDGCRLCLYSLPSNRHTGFIPGISFSLGKSF
jgi:hypothetical protein